MLRILKVTLFGIITLLSLLLNLSMLITRSTLMESFTVFMDKPPMERHTPEGMAELIENIVLVKSEHYMMAFVNVILLLLGIVIVIRFLKRVGIRNASNDDQFDVLVDKSNRFVIKEKIFLSFTILGVFLWITGFITYFGPSNLKMLSMNSGLGLAPSSPSMTYFLYIDTLFSAIKKTALFYLIGTLLFATGIITLSFSARLKVKL